MSASKRVNITIPEDILEMAKKYATEKNYTLSAFIKRALEKAMSDSVFRVEDDVYNQVVEHARSINMQSQDFLRQVLEDALSANKVTISCSKETQDTYYKMFAFDDVSDAGFEPYFKKAMAQYLQEQVINKLKED